MLLPTNLHNSRFWTIRYSPFTVGAVGQIDHIPRLQAFPRRLDQGAESAWDYAS